MNVVALPRPVRVRHGVAASPAVQATMLLVAALAIRGVMFGNPVTEALVVQALRTAYRPVGSVRLGGLVHSVYRLRTGPPVG